MKKKIDLVLRNPEMIVTGDPIEFGRVSRRRGESISITADRIQAIAAFGDLADQFDLSGAGIVDCSGKILAPGFIDSHTHVVFGGTRVEEYALRMTHSVEAVRAKGVLTGIVASMQMTRAESEAQLIESATRRLRKMLAHGTTTVESKSGYGLSLEQELKMLAVNRLLQNPVKPLPDIISTFLGAHAFPPGIARPDYVRSIVDEMLPRVVEGGLASFCDVYIDDGYFDLPQTREILTAAQAAGLKIKIHADQYGALGGSELAAELRAVSADHLNYTSPSSMRKLAEAGVVGVLMPLIDFAVRHPRPFDARGMVDAGMTLALATDICPGGWTESMQLVIQFACRQHGLSLDEAFWAATLGSARALDLPDRGTLAAGMRADIQVLDIPTFEDLVYRIGSNAVSAVVLGGEYLPGSDLAGMN